MKNKNEKKSGKWQQEVKRKTDLFHGAEVFSDKT